MSWSLHFVDTPEKVIEGLERDSQNLTGHSKIEFDAVMPSLCTLVRQHYDKQAENPVKVSLRAYGSGVESDSRCNRTVYVELKREPSGE